MPAQIELFLSVTFCLIGLVLAALAVSGHDWAAAPAFMSAAASGWTHSGWKAASQ